MNSRKALIGLFVAVFLFSLIVTLPSSLLGVAISYASQGRIKLANCGGTVWQGSAKPLLYHKDVNDPPLALGTAQWDVSIASLFTLQPRINLRWVDEVQPRPTEIRISGGQLQLNDFYLKLPASALGEVSAYLRPIKLGGNIVLKSDSMKISTHQLQGTLVGDWTGAYSGLSSLSPLGIYRFVISGSETGGDLSLATTSGMLILNGKGQFDSAGVVKFNGHAQAAEGQQEKLGELLRHLGPETSPGRHTLSLSSN